MNKQEYSRARKNKDKNYDGKFFFAVKTTGIFCRPSCPAPTANEENVVYFDNIFGPISEGFVPCKRCRPDITVDFYEGNPAQNKNVSDALKLIYAGYLNDHKEAELAARFGLSERHLRKLFTDHAFTSPNKVAIYARALFAKKLVLESSLSMTDVAFAAGYGSVRRFNTDFKTIFGSPPSMFRNSHDKIPAGKFTFKVGYDEPFDFKRMLEFMRPRLIPGVESIINGTYYRSFGNQKKNGIFSVSDQPNESCLKVNIWSDDLGAGMLINSAVRRMFDIECDIDNIIKFLKQTPILRTLPIGKLISRIPKAFSVYEFIIRAIIGQQISVKGATTIAGRIVKLANLITGNEKASFLFPTPDQMMGLDLDGIGLTKKRQETIHRVTEAIITENLSLDRFQSFEEFHDSFCMITGIGDWTAQYVGMRAMGYADCFPTTDLGIKKAMINLGVADKKKEFEKASDNWRPFRSYAAFCLWNSLG